MRDNRVTLVKNLPQTRCNLILINRFLELEGGEASGRKRVQLPFLQMSGFD